MSDVVAIKAHAKLNLALAVGAPEPPTSAKPGYHPIVSWFSAIELADHLTVRRLAPGDRSRFSIRFAPDAPSPDAGKPANWPLELDLSFRAHALLEREARRPLPIDLTLTKHIPAGGGLGGGSSDAAATLLAIDRLYQLSLPASTLALLAAALGSDVPFFLDEHNTPPRPALVTGFGERIERLPRRACGVVLVLPPFGVSTAAVYKAFDKRPHLFSAGVGIPVVARTDLPIWRIQAGLDNSLAAPASGEVEPQLGHIAAHVRRETGMNLHLSGSGSTMFHLCDPNLVAEFTARLQVAVAPFEGVRVGPYQLV